MSLILPERKLIFLHIPKCAGQSVQQALGVRHQHSHHKRNDLPEDWQTYLRFTFVRHPISRFLSACNYNLRVALQTQVQLRRTPTAQLSPTKRYRLHLSENRPSLSEMVEDLHRGRLKKLITFKPQSLWLQAGVPQFIGRVETFDQDFHQLLRLIDPQRRISSQPPHTNRSRHRLMETELGPADRRHIERYYRTDFRMTGYSRTSESRSSQNRSGRG